MNKRNLNKKLVGLLMVALLWGCCGTMTSCDTMRSYWGVEGTYGDGYYDGHHHRPPKPHKHKKHKKHKHHKHHHHDDDDDD